jgi:hypothetical protein
MMKKLAVNKQHGGFNISAKALKLLIERGAKCVEITPEAEYYGTDNVELHLKEQREESWGSLYNDTDAGDGYVNRGGLGDTPLFKDGMVYDFDDDYPDRLTRADPDLIDVIEELAAEADGFCAKLRVVEIPDDVEYSIEEYDGLEWVAEKHRTW